MSLGTENTREWYQSTFQVFEKSLNGESKSPLHSVRRAAIARFAEIGFPTTRDEEWKFTNVAPIAKVNFKSTLENKIVDLGAEEVAPYLFAGMQSHLLVFMDGRFSLQHSNLKELPKGVNVGSLADALRTHPDLVNNHLTRYAKFEDNAFTALSTAFLREGAFVFVPDQTILANPIYLLFLSTGREENPAFHPRNLIIVGKNSQVSIIERYAGMGRSTYLNNIVTEVVVGENAVVEHDKLQDESEAAFHVSSIHVVQNARSNFTSNSVSFGGDLVRNNVTSVLNAQDCECTLNGLSLATGKQHVDNHTTIDHASPHCRSHELYKSILDGKAKGVFNGKIFVRRDAQKTDAKQTNKTLLLSDDATIDTKPQLEIFADDVKCTHGATVGQLDEEQVFYLRARGIGLEQARDILTFAFASDVISRIHVEPLREQLDRMLQARLRKGREEEAV